MASRENPELVPLTDGSGRANEDDQEAQHQKIPQAGDDPYGLDGGPEQLLQPLKPKNVLCQSLLVLQVTIGMGMLWRFPYMCQKYGGGTFFIPYMVVMCLVGYPLLVMEIGIGQKLRYGSITIWTKINPQLGGISIVMCLVTIAMTCYYGTIIVWCYKYLADLILFQDLALQPDPKLSQTYWHKTVLNVTSSMDEFSEIQYSHLVATCIVWFTIALFMIIMGRIHGKFKYINMNLNPNVSHALPAIYYSIVPAMLLVLYIAQSGYGFISLMYITSIRLKDLLVLPIWVDAVIQVFCSLGLVYGPWISFGSVSKRNSNFLLIATMVISWSVNIAFVWTWFIYSSIIPNVMKDIKTCVIGSAYKWDNSKDMPAHVFYNNSYDALIASRKLDDTLTNFDVQECNMENQFKLASNGIGIVFTALRQFYIPIPIGKLFNKDFEVSLNLALLYLQSVVLLSLVCSIKWFIWALTEIESLRKVSRLYIAVMLCLICSVCGLAFTTRSGVYWFILYNDIFISSSLTVLALCEVLIIVFIYGYKQFLLDIYDMNGQKVSRLSKFIWRHITPMLLMLTFSAILTIGILDGFRYEVWTHKNNFLTKERYPYWAELILWSITAVCLLLILTFCMVSRQKFNLKFNESFSKIKNATCGQNKRSDIGLSEKDIITEINFDDCPDSENDEDIDNSMAQVPVRMYKIEVLDSWKSARGQVYL